MAKILVHHSLNVFSGEQLMRFPWNLVCPCHETRDISTGSKRCPVHIMLLIKMQEVLFTKSSHIACRT